MASKVIGNFHDAVPAGHVAVVIRNVERKVGENLVAVGFVGEFHDGIEHGSEHGVVQLGPLAHLALAEFDGALEAGLVRLLIPHQGAEIADLERFGEVLIVVERLEALGFEVDQLEVEPLDTAEFLPIPLVDPLRDTKSRLRRMS